jgi:hypothetical protein
MKAVMRLQKTQVPAIVKKTTPQSGNWDRRLHMMAGYTQYQCVLVGAAGGDSGRCNANSTNIVYEYGCGGGGSLVFSGTLQSLADLTPFVVGAEGADGADHGDNTLGGSGKDGGSSSFAGKSAYGGKGATGGKINVVTGANTWQRGVGGDGGLNSEGLGTVGVGGAGHTDDRDNGTAGTWGTSGTISGGGGGGGGAARMLIDNDTKYMAASGGTGSNGSGFGDGGQDFNNWGGAGGGFNVEIVTGVDERYGRRNAPHPDGVVILKMS